jgi:hypothetical protein
MELERMKSRKTHIRAGILPALCLALGFIGLTAAPSPAVVITVPEGSGQQQTVSDIVPVVPRTLEEMVDASQLVVLGRVASVSEAKSDRAPESNTIRETRKNMVATFSVKETFKGAVAGDTIAVEFIQSSVRESPPPVTLSKDEDCVLFLINSVAGRFAIIGTTYGKEPASPAMLSQLRTKTGTTPEERGKIGLHLDGTSPFAAGGPVTVRLTISNSSLGEAQAYENIAGAAQFSVTGPDGNPPARSGGPAAVKSPVMSLYPGHSLTAEIDLSKQYDLTAPGNYRVAARLAMPGGGAAAQAPTLVSNSLDINIVQEK